MKFTTTMVSTTEAEQEARELTTRDNGGYDGATARSRGGSDTSPMKSSTSSRIEGSIGRTTLRRAVPSLSR